MKKDGSFNITSFETASSWGMVTITVIVVGQAGVGITFSTSMRRHRVSSIVLKSLEQCGRKFNDLGEDDANLQNSLQTCNKEVVLRRKVPT